MVGFLIRRIGQALLVLVIVTVITLGIVPPFPGGPGPSDALAPEGESHGPSIWALRRGTGQN